MSSFTCSLKSRNPTPEQRKRVARLQDHVLLEASPNARYKTRIESTPRGPHHATHSHTSLCILSIGDFQVKLSTQAAYAPGSLREPQGPRLAAHLSDSSARFCPPRLFQDTSGRWRQDIHPAAIVKDLTLGRQRPPKALFIISQPNATHTEAPHRRRVTAAPSTGHRRGTSPSPTPT